MSAINLTIYPDRAHLVEVSPHQHREELLTAAATDRTGAGLAARVADWVAGTEAVYVTELGDSSLLAGAVRAAVGKLDPAPPLRTSGRAEDHVVGDVPITGSKVVRPADEAAVVMGEAPEGAFPVNGDPAAARPLIGKPLPSPEDSAGKTHSHHVGGERRRDPDAEQLQASDAPTRATATLDPVALGAGTGQVESAAGPGVQPTGEPQARPTGAPDPDAPGEQTTSPGGSDPDEPAEQPAPDNAGETGSDPEATEQPVPPVTDEEAAAEPRTIAALQEELRGRHLPVSGSKRELLQRLRDDDADHGRG